MNKPSQCLIFALCVLMMLACRTQPPSQNPVSEAEPKPTRDRPTLSLTFDDGITRDLLNYPFKEWNEMILSALDSADLQAAFFVTGANKRDAKGRFLLKSWDQRGHMIANHTFTHPNFNNEKVSLADFKKEVLQTDEVIRGYNNYSKYFRFPYLKGGNTPEKVHGFRAFCDSLGYELGFVTIDASDWYVNSRMIKRLKADPEADIEPYRQYYLDHLWERAQFYEEVSASLNGRHIPHTLLLHHNLTSALFLPDLIKMFRERGWDLVDASEAFADSIFDERPQLIPAGESLIWALGRESGRFDDVLRYPPEDSQYEVAKMDSLGL
ncbi:MAG: polysaccharide deacetylase family protein [Bacteroidota bacterium]